MDNRRDFIKKVVVGSTLASVGGLFLLPVTSHAAKKKSKKLALNISFQEGIPVGNSLSEKFDYMEKLGVTGFEPGGGGLAGRVKEIQDALRNRNIKVSAICAGFGGWLLADDPATKKRCIDSSKEILAAAGELGSVGMILVPAFNNQKSFPHTAETRERLVNDLKELGAYAHRHGTSIILEPLNRREAFYLRMVADAASICRDVDSPGVTCMGDFWHMTWEETSDKGAILSGGEYLSHMHIASRKRRIMPGEDGEADNYISGFQGLKELGYKGFVSFECGTVGKREETVPAAVQLMKKQWDMA